VSALAYAGVAIAASTCTCGGSIPTDRNGRFTLATIAIDGASTGASGPLTGWDTIKADRDNNICDANSTGAPTELGGADGIADQPQALGRDLTWFAFTWDAINVYFFTQRAGNASSVQRFVYYGDLNNDGKMQTGERVIQVEWNGSNRLIKIYRASYNAVAVGGDGLADSIGVADGYILPGNLTQIDALNADLHNGNWGSTDGSEMEFYVSWAELGLSGPTAIRFHVSSMNGNFNNNNPPNGTVPGFSGVEDNMAGCGGGTGSTQFADIAVTTPNTITEPHGTLTCSRFTVTNNGNANDLFELTNSIGTFSGAGGGTPTISYFYDTNANNVYDAGTDLAVTNTNSPTNTTLDTGTLTPLQTRNIFECALATAVNAYTPSGSATVTTTFTSIFDSQVTATNTTTVTILLAPNITLTKSSTAVSDPTNNASNPKRIPGGFVDYSITATNSGGGALTTNTVIITDPIPANTELYVNSLGGSPAGSPITQSNGTPACGLTLSFTALGNGTDGVEFYNSTPALITPVANGNGTDTAVASIRLLPTGVFAGATAAGNPSCSWTFRVRVK
jgi:hypothetical protein